MVDVQLLGRLGLLAERRRWFVGLAVDRNCRRLTTALVAVPGRGLGARPQLMAHHQSALPSDVQQGFARLKDRRRAEPAAAAMLAAQLAERQAALLDELAAQIAPVWHRVLAVAVHDPGLWHRETGWTVRACLCDSARLAELCGQNVIDDFAGRDLAQDGRGRPLMPLAHWVLLHDPNKSRLLVQWGRQIRLTWLPSSRDAASPARIRSVTIALGEESHDPSSLVEHRARLVVERGMSLGQVDEWVLACGAQLAPAIESALALQSQPGRVIAVATLGVAAGALRANGAAVLGMLHVDQVPANLPGITGTRTARVLGRLTPGGLTQWHRLVADLAAARPSVVALRSAV